MPECQFMRDTDLFQLALGLVPPWQVKACAFDAERKRLDIEMDFFRGGRFPCPQCAKADCPVHDTSMQKWRRCGATIRMRLGRQSG